LNEVGFIEGQNITIEYRFALGQYDQLRALATDLVARRCALILAGGNAASLAAKDATRTVPIVFAIGSDPVALGLVASLARPGGNITGVSFLNNVIVAKQIEILHELVPKTAAIGFLANANSPNADMAIRETQTAAAALGQRLFVVNGANEMDFDTAFARLLQQQVGALVIDGDAFFYTRREQIVEQTARSAIPTVYPWREAAFAGGLMSYGTSITDAYRQVGVYTGRILKGEKPADLPVQQSTKVELVINLKTAKKLGLTFPLSLLGRADEVIE
jgi:putative ABC transport system substrate-binding protein